MIKYDSILCMDWSEFALQTQLDPGFPLDQFHDHQDKNQN